MLAYARWLRGPFVPARRTPGNNDYWIREAEIFESWRDAGFRLSPKPVASGDADLDRVELEAWVERQGAEVARCLEN